MRKKATSGVRPAKPTDMDELRKATGALVLAGFQWQEKGGGAYNLADRKPADLEFLEQARGLVNAMSNALAAVELASGKGLTFTATLRPKLAAKLQRYLDATNRQKGTALDLADLLAAEAGSEDGALRLWEEASCASSAHPEMRRAWARVKAQHSGRSAEAVSR